MKYLIILVTMFFITSCYDSKTEEGNPLLINLCNSDSDCKDNLKPKCNFVIDNDNKTERFECTPIDCFGWVGKNGIDVTISFYTDLDNNCYKEIL